MGIPEVQVTKRYEKVEKEGHGLPRNIISDF